MTSTTSDSSALDREQLEECLHSLERRFEALDGPWDDPLRQALWPELATHYTELGSREEAALCWLNALWEADLPPLSWANTWVRAEWGKYPEGVTTREIQIVLDGPASTHSVRKLTAYLVWACGEASCPKALEERRNDLGRYLHQHDHLLPIRGAWIALSCLVRLGAEGRTALAQVRDRLLGRLFRHGLRPEQDLPSFLRFARYPTGQRFRAVQQWMSGLADQAQKWVQANADAVQKPPMDAYVDLMFAFGLARLGEADAARERLARAQKGLTGKDDAHTFLLEAFRYRITQALDGKPLTGPLPAELLDSLKGMVTLLNYVVDLLRRQSRILEPEQEIDPYRKWGARISELDSQLADMAELSDRKEIQSRVQRLLNAVPKGKEGAEARFKIIRGALEAAPRVGEEFGREMLDQGQRVYDALPEPTDTSALAERASFLEKALFVAAHFDSVAHIHQHAARFERLLEGQRSGRGDSALEKMEKLASGCFRGLRKLGMRDQIDRLLTQMADLVLQGKDLASVDAVGLRALLIVAGEWYFFGRDAQAEPVLQAARVLLLSGDLAANDTTNREQTKLACAYARTVGRAPVTVAQKRLEELFTSVKGVKDTYTTSSHFSVSQLGLVEAVVLAVVSDDFTLGTQARRWLDEDEFLVRRRIHNDMRVLAALSPGL